MTERLMLVSADCHAGPPMADYRPYIDAVHRDRFDDYVGAVAAYDDELRTMQERRGGNQERMAQLNRGAGNVSGLWDPDVRIRDLDGDGIAAEVIFPQGSIPFHPHPANIKLLPRLVFTNDPTVLAAGVRAYNRWLADFCDLHPGRHAGVAVAPMHDVDAAAAEVVWARGAGLRSVSLPVMTDDTPKYHDPVYEPLWQVCEELDMPLTTHGASITDYGPSPAAYPIVLTECDWFVRRALWFMMWGGVFERHPGLKLVFTEQRCGWVQNALVELDSVFHSKHHEMRSVLSMRPSDYFRRNCWLGASFMSRQECEHRDVVGTERFMWGSDYPHREGTWPQTAESLRMTFAGVPVDDVRLMLGETAADVYGLDAAQLRGVAERIGPTPADIDTPLDAVPEGGDMTWAFREGSHWS